MVEQYVIEEIKKLKEENEKLKEELNTLLNNELMKVDIKPVYVKLLEKEIIIKKLEENNIDIIKIYDECDSKEITKIIIENNLFRDRKQSSEVKFIARYRNKYYEVKDYYGNIKLDDEVYATLEDAIYYEISDDFYDLCGDYKRKIEKEKKESEKTDE